MSDNVLFPSGSESFEGWDEVYGSPEEFLKYLESHACDCDFCDRRIIWLRKAINDGVKLEPPYMPSELFEG